MEQEQQQAGSFISSSRESETKADRSSPPESRSGADLHAAIMNLRPEGVWATGMNDHGRTAYKLGHRDARHAAAELALAYDGLLDALRAVSFSLSATRDDEGEPSFMKQVRAAIARAEGR